MKVTKTKKQVVTLYICTIVGMALGIVSSMINTHFLIPSEYGDVRYVVNILNFFSGILLVGYFVSGSRLLALAENVTEAKRIKGGMLFILFLLAIILTSLLVLTALYHWYIGKPFWRLFLYVIPVSANIMLLNYINTSSQGDNSIGTIALARLLPSAVYVVLSFFLYNVFGTSSLFMLLLQNGIALIILLTLILRNGFSFRDLKKTLSDLHAENKKYGLQVYYGSLANVSVQYIAGLTLGLWGADNTNVGYYSLALAITAPLHTLPSIVGTTYFKQFATQASINNKVVKTTYGMSIISYIVYAIFIFPLVDVIYSESYSTVAYFSVLLALGATFHGLGDVYNRFLGAHGRGTMLRNGAFISGFVAIMGYTVGVYVWGINGAILTRVLSSLAYYLSMILFYSIFVKTKKAK